jgi:hypothetical protein
MSRILAIGSSHLASFKLGVNIANKQSQLLPEIDFAGIWETGFGYLRAPRKITNSQKPYGCKKAA